MNTIKPFLYIGLGGMIGSIARYALHLLISSRTLTLFPWGTLVVNVSGCLLIGLLVGLESRNGLINEPLKWLLITGFCGGFTTFSTFSMEGLGLLHQQQIGSYLGYTLGSLVVGLFATYMGYTFVRWIV